jgi:hypothetical protein
VDPARKRAYDLACLICSFIDGPPVRGTVKNARKYYARQDLLHAREYVDLVQQRQDFHFTDVQRDELKQALRDECALPLRQSRVGA